MEAFSLLKYWRGGGGGAAALSAAARPAVSVTTIAASALPSAEESDEESADGGDEGPFFDLEFAVPDEECEGADGNEDGSSSREGEEVTDDEGAAEEREFNFTVSSEGSCGDLRADPSLPLSPSDDLFFKGRLVPLESSSLVFNNHGEAHARPHMLPVSLLKTKFRVLMLGLRRPKHVSAAAAPAAGEHHLNGSAAAAAPSPKHPHQRPSKLFTVKFKVEEVPIVSLFTRDSSSRSTGSSNGRSSKQQGGDECAAAAAAAGEKKLSKELVQKYINKIKPLYVRASKRYAEKMRFSGQLPTEGAVSKETPAQAPTPPSTDLPSGRADPPPRPSPPSPRPLRRRPLATPCSCSLLVILGLVTLKEDLECSSRSRAQGRRWPPWRRGRGGART